MLETVILLLCLLNIGLSAVVVFSFMQRAQRRKDLLKSLTNVENRLLHLSQLLQDEMSKNRVENNVLAKEMRSEVFTCLDRFNEAVLKRLREAALAQAGQMDSFSGRFDQWMQRNEDKFAQMKEKVDLRLKQVQADNREQLEKMRQVVDEKLHESLEKRLGESFELVSRRLEQVYKGLGEMQTLASGVGDLKKVLTNIKTRGIWGEVQLSALLEQILAPEQYAVNVATVPNSSDRVEFALKLPGKEYGVVWMPIDAKFPLEDYQRLLEAQENADSAAVEQAARALEIRMQAEAKNIAEKYISAPHTTEFGILFLPVEGLYAEVLRRTGLIETLQQKYKVVVAGPTTLAALLNSLQMGFRTLAIERRSSEVWAVLSAVKTEFLKFGVLLDKTNKKLQEASNVMDTAARKSRTIERKLKMVQELPETEAAALLEEKNSI